MKTAPSPFRITKTPPISQNSPPQTDTSGWKTYFETGYQIKVPNEWTQPVSSGESTSWSAPDSSQLQIRTEPAYGRTIAQYLEDSDRQSQSSWEGQPSKKIDSSKTVSVDSHTGIQRQEEWLAAGFTTTVTYLPMGTNVLIIAALPSSNPPQQAEVLKIYSTIIASLKFL